MRESNSGLTALERRLGADWQHLRKAKVLAEAKRKELTKELRELTTDDTSIVVFGSLARDEFTEGSDIDWTLLVDGAADPRHLDQAKEIEAVVQRLAKKGVGREGTFGKLAFSHDVVHQIGGQSDSNQNTTRRILLLLESMAVGRTEAYERVVNSVLSRYVLEDRGFLAGSADHHIPRFLLNDFARYWWTMAVDFAYKHRTRFGEGAAIRNLKLRMSRKLIYVSGMLTCFSCHLDATPCSGGASVRDAARAPECIQCLRAKLQLTPLEVIAGTFLRYPHLDSTALELLSAYNDFLGILSSAKSRSKLEKLGEAEYEQDRTYQKARKLSHHFRDALVKLFFDDRSGISDLTKIYGVF
ncbi:nucleotidyltransferase domain-containing protein [uncultured Paludibaculum sp.]|uniref:nucleotidyltransferase domain-containing protein n=1 Tax=uncultured Paludibaculum sp. TaxID=1765020 RepID=UPI002AAAA753|nr:nucleotidyltransferase domain-containing protein [uncultured Paludibaculum sp.]